MLRCLPYSFGRPRHQREQDRAWTGSCDADLRHDGRDRRQGSGRVPSGRDLATRPLREPFAGAPGNDAETRICACMIEQGRIRRSPGRSVRPRRRSPFALSCSTASVPPEETKERTRGLRLHTCMVRVEILEGIPEAKEADAHDRRRGLQRPPHGHRPEEDKPLRGRPFPPARGPTRTVRCLPGHGCRLRSRVGSAGMGRVDLRGTAS